MNNLIYFRFSSPGNRNTPQAEASISQNVLCTYCSTGLSASSFPLSSCQQKSNFILNPHTAAAITADGAMLYGSSFQLS